jgi:hypothetical protein
MVEFAQAFAHLAAFRMQYEDDALIDSETGLTAGHLDTLIAHLSLARPVTTARQMDLVRESEAEKQIGSAGLLNDCIKSEAGRDDLRNRRDRHPKSSSLPDRAASMKKTNHDGQTFGSWLFAQQRTSVSIENLLRQAKVDRSFPRYGTPDDVRTHLHSIHATRNLLKAVDEAETFWKCAGPGSIEN